MDNYLIAQLDELDPVKCPCGFSRRAFVSDDNAVATVHLLDVADDPHCHYHKKLTEIYVVLEGQGHLELDGRLVPVKPMTAVMIKPGCRHRAVGRLKVMVVPIPAYDPEDSFED
jgi:mannose-6-phosphate isomerase-like protein (cupin superfamily)